MAKRIVRLRIDFNKLFSHKRLLPSEGERMKSFPSALGMRLRPIRFYRNDKKQFDYQKPL